MKQVTIGLIQMKCSRDKAASLTHALNLIRKAANQGAELVCLPELFLTDYFCQQHDPAIFDLAEPIPGHASKALSEVAKECGIVLIGSLFEKAAPGLYYNTSPVFERDGSMLGIYRKMHIPHDPLFYEKYYFAPGDLGYKVFDTSVGKIGVLICWDQWYPEAARLTALQGADILFYPTAIGWHPQEKAEYGAAQLSAWQTAQRAHAIANSVFVCATNRVGHEVSVGDGIEFWGNSFVADPFGRVLHNAGEQEEVVIVKADLGMIEDTRRNWPFLRDRRVDSYAGITKRFGV